MSKIQKGIVTISGFLKNFLIAGMQLSSNRVKLIWFSAFSWAATHIWYGVVLSVVRELSIIYYRQNAIVGNPISLDSVYAQSILNSTDMAFTAIVVGYIASSWKRYGTETNVSATTEKEGNKVEP